MAPDSRTAFLAAVLGPDGAAALGKAAERSPDLGNALWPRTILAWLQTVPGAFDGILPGVEGTHLRFAKSEGRYTGDITIGQEVFGLHDASVFQLLASVAVALDLDKQPVTPSIRNLDLEQLGKSIDLMVRARSATDALAKADKVECPKCEAKIWQMSGKVGFHSAKGKKCPGSGSDPQLSKEELEKAKPAGPGTGSVHKPTPKDQPIAPDASAPQPAAPKPPPAPSGVAPKKHPVTGATPITSNTLPKLPKLKPPTLKLTRSEASRECEVCGIPQTRHGVFTGCYCLSSLAKGVVTYVGNGGELMLELGGEDWDQDAIETLLEAVGR